MKAKDFFQISAAVGVIYGIFFENDTYLFAGGIILAAIGVMDAMDNVGSALVNYLKKRALSKK